LEIEIKDPRHEPLRDLTLTDLSITSTRGMRFEWITHLNLTNIEVFSSEGDPMVFRNGKNGSKQEAVP